MRRQNKKNLRYRITTVLFAAALFAWCVLGPAVHVSAQEESAGATVLSDVEKGTGKEPSAEGQEPEEEEEKEEAEQTGEEPEEEAEQTGEEPEEEEKEEAEQTGEEPEEEESEQDGELPEEEQDLSGTVAKIQAVTEEEANNRVYWTIYAEGYYPWYPFEDYPDQVTAVNRENGESQTAEVGDYMYSSGWCKYDFWLPDGTYDFYADNEKIAEKTLNHEEDKVEIEPRTYYGVWFCDESDTRPLEVCYARIGQTVSASEEPGRPGYTFDEWVKTPGGSDKFELTTPITETIKLYASWKEAGDGVITGDGWTLTKEGALTCSSNTGIENWVENGPSKYRQRVTSVKIDESVTKIPASAFEDCINLTDVVMSKNVTEFGNNAFNCCESLSSLEIPSGVTSIGEGAFFLCDAMKSITLPESVEAIGEFSFRRSGLTSVRIPSRVTEISYHAFYECSDLQSVELAEGVATIGEYAFSGSGLRSISLPSSVTEIARGAFFGCKGLTEVKLSENLTTINSEAFGECGLRSITIPKSVQYMYFLTFEDCTALERVVMKPEMPPFMLASFEGCKKMKKGSIIVPRGKAKVYKEDLLWNGYEEYIVEEAASGGSGSSGGKDDQDRDNQNQGGQGENQDAGGSNGGSGVTASVIRADGRGGGIEGQADVETDRKTVGRSGAVKGKDKDGEKSSGVTENVDRKEDGRKEDGGLALSGGESAGEGLPGGALLTSQNGDAKETEGAAAVRYGVLIFSLALLFVLLYLADRRYGIGGKIRERIVSGKGGGTNGGQ